MKYQILQYLQSYQNHDFSSVPGVGQIPRYLQNAETSKSAPLACHFASTAVNALLPRFPSPSAGAQPMLTCFLGNKVVPLVEAANRPHFLRKFSRAQSQTELAPRKDRLLPLAPLKSDRAGACANQRLDLVAVLRLALLPNAQPPLGDVERESPLLCKPL